MTCGVVVPVDASRVEDTELDSMTLLHHCDLKRLTEEPRFAAAIGRSTLKPGSWSMSYSESPYGPSPDKK